MSTSEVTSLFSEMLRLQNEVNITVNPNWIELGRKNTWDYGLAGVHEMIELADCYPLEDGRVGYKWWSKQKRTDDLALNTIMEYVDAFHFFMSFDMANRRLTLEGLSNHYNEAYRSDEYGDIQPLALLKIICADVLRTEGPFFNSVAFFGLGVRMGIDVDKLYSVYIAKNTLNKFRQAHGYKQGTYTKTWEPGREDNAVLMEWVTGLHYAASAESVNSFLTEKYHHVVEAAKAV